mgnify:CR=1 FL=1
MAVRTLAVMVVQVELALVAVAVDMLKVMAALLQAVMVAQVALVLFV